MVLSLIPAVVGVAVTAVLAVASVLSGALTASAGAVAALFGAFVVILGGFPFLGLLVLFVVASVLATRYGFDEKHRQHVQEGRGGERGVSNVVAHATVPAALVATATIAPSLLPAPALAALYTAALAFGTSDTFASELGVLSGRARSILTWRPVTPGTNGGVSGMGELWAFVGALSMSLVAAALFLLFGTPAPVAAAIVGGGAAAGFLGCQVDSVLGETLENRGYLGKGSTNFLAMVASLAIGALFLGVSGGLL